MKRRNILRNIFIYGLVMLFLNTSLAFADSYTPIGKGCTNAYYIDRDCDGYGVASPFGPDADDSDSEVNTPGTILAKYATLDNFLQHLGYNADRIFFIAKDGSDTTGEVDNIDKPYAALRGVVHGLLQPGDMVIFREGNYSDGVGVGGIGTDTKPVAALAYPGEKVILTAENTALRAGNYIIYDGFIVEDSSFDGFLFHHATFRNIESRHNSRGMHTDGEHDVLIENCVFHDNGTHGIYLNGYYPTSYPSYNITVRGCISYRNGRHGIQFNGACDNLTVENCIFHSNTLGGISAINGVANSTFRNNLIFNNKTYGIILYNYPEADSDGNNILGIRSTDNNKIINNTIWSRSNDAAAIHFNESSGSTFTYTGNIIRNNILINGSWWETAPIEMLQGRHFAGTTIENNIIYRTEGSVQTAVKLEAQLLTLAQAESQSDSMSSNIYADPKFTDVSLAYTSTPERFNFDYLLSSPAINSGIDTDAPALDLRGNSRAGGIDAGCYEYRTAPTNQCPAADAGSDTIAVDSDDNWQEDVILDASGSSDPDGSIVRYVWYDITGVNPDEGKELGTGQIITLPFEVGSYDVMLKVVDNNGCLSSDQIKVTVKEGSNVIRLKNGWQNYTGNAFCRLRQDDPNRNYYTPDWASGWVGLSGGVNRQAVSFDDLFAIISSIPPSNNITRAELRLYQTTNGLSQGQYGNNQLFALKIPFDPATVCWNSPWSVPGGGDDVETGPISVVDLSDGRIDLWRQWDVTPYVQGVRSGTWPDYGFLLRQEKESINEMNSWYGHHHYAEALRPELIIHFASPIEADTTAPVISDIVVSNISNDQATIIWQTDKPSTSTVEYGLDTSYGNQATDPTLTMVHSITLTGLNHHTTYHFRVKSWDGSPQANEAVSGDQTFSTSVKTEIWGENSQSDHPGTCFDTSFIINQTGSYPTYPELWITPGHGSGAAWKRMAVLYFDLADLPPQSVISRAYLKLYANPFYPGGTNIQEIAAYRITDPDRLGDWDRAEADWFNRSSPWRTGGADITTVLSDPLDTITVNPATSLTHWFSWEVTSAAAGWSDGSFPNQGIFLATTDLNSPTGNLFSSSEAADASLRPILEITYFDTATPVISDVTVFLITGEGARITWTTDELSNSQVEYGLGTNYGSFSALDTTRTRTHQVDLHGLLPNTTYHFRVRSADPSANLALSPDQGFATVALDTTPPVISGVEILNILDRSATIRWSTNEIANSIVDFGQTLAYGSTASDSTHLTFHQINLSGLLPNTTYYFRIRGNDPSGNKAVSEGHILFTKSEIVTISFQNGALPSSEYSGCEDATISDDYYNMHADTNYGNSSNIESMRSSEGFLIKWNISSLPAGAIIDSANISLMQVWASSSSGHTLKAYGVLQDWEELEATWNSRKTGTLWNSSGLGATSDTAPQNSAFDRRATDCGSFQTVGANHWCSLTVTPSLVQAWAKGSPANYGLFITPEAEGNSFFYSSEYTNPSSVSPSLTISYHFPAEPQIFITQPPQTGAATNGTYPITWLDHCPEVSAAISLYYDSDDTGYNGIQITGGISEDDETDSYSWNTSGVPEGTYYVYSKIDDGVNPAVLSYSKGPLTIDHTPPAVIIVSPSDGSSTSQPRVSISGTSTDTGTGVKVVVINAGKGNRGDTTNFSFDDVDLVPDTNTFIVTATDYAGNSGADTISIYYSPCPPPVADFTALETTGYAPLNVCFTDSSTGNVTSWDWDLDGDGISDTTVQNLCCTYNTAGTYTVTLTVSGECGSDSKTMTDYITTTSPYIYLLTNKTVRNITRNTEYSDNSDGIAGDRVEFRITLTNIGTSGVKDVLAYDTVPVGLTYKTGSITGTGAVASGAPNLIWNVGTLDAGASDTLTFQATVNQ